VIFFEVDPLGTVFEQSNDDPMSERHLRTLAKSSQIELELSYDGWRKQRAKSV